ncbi:MAG: DNA polymerase III subunit gamma/tau [Paludibacter sp.]|jgi:DNA polymerase-3 subunit gamma/tau|nr:DNA polymerase III subunit gamma/tau [Paludibacter sp.]
MENFIVSARKYRPSTFKSVVGQNALTTTLRNAIQTNHLAHAYLFCGPRGVGKTTCARIFAKTINCQQLTADGEACNQCESCVSFNEQRSYNIHELDAASNNGVDDIRSLIDQVRIPPQIGQYSVYIIDEVHMLSPGAFNAFLKTLEEPPAHAIFILATTEKHKIIPTILSRCQIYDFNRITIADTVSHLRYVASSENVSIDENALNIIAQKSDGGMRDALSIFDQLVSFCGTTIDYQSAIQNLNVLDYEYYFKLTDAFLQGDVTNSLLIFNEILNKGFDGHHFVTGLSSHFRDLLVCKDPATIELMEVGADIGKRYIAQAQACETDFLIPALKITTDCDMGYRISNNKRLLVELSLIRLCQLTSAKKKIITDEELPPLQAVFPTTGNATSGTSTPTVQGSTPATNSVSTAALTQKKAPAPQPIVRSAAAPAGKRPISISINRGTATQASTTPANPHQEVLAETADEHYSQEAFELAWKAYAQKIPTIASAASYIRSTLPVRTEAHVYEISFSNIFQENEFKTLMTDLSNHMRQTLRNSAIRFVSKVTEASEVPRTGNPEEILRKMMEENPALELLKNTLKLEID